MKLIEVLITAILYLSAVSGNKLYDSKLEEEETTMTLEKPIRGHTSKHKKTGRESRNLFYNDYDADDFGRNDFNKNSYRIQNKLVTDILQKIDQINLYLKTSQPTSSQVQIKCVPAYYLNSLDSHRFIKQDDIPNINFETRWADIDVNRIWGLVPPEPVQRIDDSGSIKPGLVEPNSPTTTAPPVVDTSSQVEVTTKPAPVKSPGKCKAAILVCCQRKTRSERQLCFSKYSCAKLYTVSIVCNPEIVNYVINEFIESYAP